MQTYWKNNTPPSPPYYAVIFISEKNDALSGYEDMNNRTMEGALALPGCLGYSAVPGNFVSYWDSMESINTWRNDQTHKEAKLQGKRQWYRYYHSIIAKVECSHEFFSTESSPSPTSSHRP